MLLPDQLYSNIALRLPRSRESEANETVNIMKGEISMTEGHQLAMKTVESFSKLSHQQRLTEPVP